MVRFVLVSLAALAAARKHEPRADVPVPASAQVIDPRSFAALEAVMPVTEHNITTTFIPPGTDRQSLAAKPFHVYDDEFLAIIGASPSLSKIAESETDPLFHEAVVWYPRTEEVFFTQNAGSPAAGTGLNKSAIIQKISLAEVARLEGNVSGRVGVETVHATPAVINPNGASNYKGKLIYAGQGQDKHVPPALYVMEPVAPFNTTVLVNNFYGRQFNSLNDVAVNPANKDVYFTDPNYAQLQGFRPESGLPPHVYRYSEATGAVTVVADQFSMPNGLAFSPDGRHAYVTDSGAAQTTVVATRPSSIYRFEVAADGTFEDRKKFAYVSTGIPDGITVDANGNVYAGCGDGVHVWNASGKFLGKIYVGSTVASLEFAGEGRMVVCAETALYYVTLAASGSYVAEYM